MSQDKNNSIDWQSDRKDNIAKVFPYVRYLLRFGLLRQLDFLILNISEDVDLIIMLALIRYTAQLHKNGKLKYWREGRDRMMQIYRYHGIDEEKITETFTGLLEL